MDNKEYIDLLCERYSRYFDIRKDYELMGKKLDIFAEYNAINERYVLSKKAVLDAYESYEYCLVSSCCDYIDANNADIFTEYLVHAAKMLVKPGQNHMCTYITGVMVAEHGFSDEAALAVKKFRYSKDFLFTIHGWCDARLVMADPSANIVITNKKGRDVQKYYAVS